VQGNAQFSQRVREGQIGMQLSVKNLYLRATPRQCARRRDAAAPRANDRYPFACKLAHRRLTNG
jgi:hypothetical protein